MRIDEIINETPLAVAAGATWVGTVFAAFNLALSAYDLYDINEILKRNNYTTAAMSDEDWEDLVLDVLFLIPGLALAAKFKGSKQLVKASIPKPVMTKMVQSTKTKLAVKPKFGRTES
jgi:hypothetical protein